MALVKLDLIPYMEDSDWFVIDDIVKQRLKHLMVDWDKLLPCLSYTVEVNYYTEEVGTINGGAMDGY
jgi:hypothetical protein